MRPWTNHEIARLTEWWEAGVRAPVIGKRLHRTKEAVWTKRRKLALPRRPNGIQAKQR